MACQEPLANEETQKARVFQKVSEPSKLVVQVWDGDSVKGGMREVSETMDDCISWPQ